MKNIRGHLMAPLRKLLKKKIWGILDKMDSLLIILVVALILINIGIVYFLVTLFFGL